MGISSSPATAGASGSLGCDLFLLPEVLDVEGFTVLDDSEGIEEQLVHTGAKRLHLGKWARRSLAETLVVRLNPGVVLQGRESGHIDNRSQLRPAALGNGRSSRDLAAFSSRGLETSELQAQVDALRGELDELRQKMTLRKVV